MIKTIKHKGLREFYEKGTRRGINPQQAMRIQDVLTRLDLAECPEDMDAPGLRWHALKGKMAGYYAVSISGNWRIIFRFEGNAPVDVNLVDYH